MKRTIGILLDERAFSGIPRKRTGSEKVGFYTLAARKLALRPFFMSLRQIGSNSAAGYTGTSKGERLTVRPIPKVIHNRDITLRSDLKKKLDRLAKKSIVFNRINRFSKYHIHRVLAKHAGLRAYLPAAAKYSRSRLESMMERYDSLFIKPTSGSVGSGVMKISRESNGKWQIYREKQPPALKSFRRTAELVDRAVGGRSYLIQETIRLATYRGRPYDIRVSVQRDGTGEWQVTGMVGKVAAPGRHVTNVAKGGKVRRCKELFEASGLPVQEMKLRLAEASLSIARHLGEHLPHLADIGLDMGVDLEGRIKFIEMNGRDQRYSFREAGLDKTFFNTYYIPLQYAKHLLDTRDAKG